MRILLFALDNWVGTAQLPRALTKAGASVAISCPPQTFLSLTRFRDQYIPHGISPSIRGPVAELRAAIQKAAPDFIIAGDEAALDVLHALALDPRWGGTEEEVELIEFSCGDPEFYRTTRNKHETLLLAESIGIRVPQHRPVSLVMDALMFAEENGYPVVMKPDDGIGGIGVTFCRDEDELAEACRGLRGTWTVNQFIDGPTAGSAAVTWEGRVVEGIAYQKIWSNPHPTGPSTLIRLSADSEMVDATVRIAEALSCTGYVAPGFVYSKEGVPYLTEVNTRFVSMGTFGHLLGANLNAALIDAFNGTMRTPTWPSGQTVMMYPQERFRDANSRPEPGWIEDIPEDDPELHSALEKAIRDRAAANPLRH